MVEKMVYGSKPPSRSSGMFCQTSKLSTLSELSACAAWSPQGMLSPFPPGTGSGRRKNSQIPIQRTYQFGSLMSSLMPRQRPPQRSCGDLRVGLIGSAGHTFHAVSIRLYLSFLSLHSNCTAGFIRIMPQALLNRRERMNGVALQRDHDRQRKQKRGIREFFPGQQQRPAES